MWSKSQRTAYNHTGVVVALPNARSEYRIERTEGRDKGKHWFASASSLIIVERGES